MLFYPYREAKATLRKCYKAPLHIIEGEQAGLYFIVMKNCYFHHGYFHGGYFCKGMEKFIQP